MQVGEHFWKIWPPKTRQGEVARPRQDAEPTAIHAQ